MTTLTHELEAQDLSLPELEAFDPVLAALNIPEAELATFAEEGSWDSTENLLEFIDQMAEAEAVILSVSGEVSINTAFVNNYLRDRVKRLIDQLRDWSRRYRYCASCIPPLTRASIAFAARRYPTALRYAAISYHCFLQCRR